MSGGVHNTLETVNAAATAIVTAETRVQPSTVQKRRWRRCWSIYWCFGSYNHSKRIGHAVIVSEPATTGIIAPAVESRDLSSTRVLPFIAPPSSPASFLHSDPPSATQSPAGLLPFRSLSVDVHSPGATAPIFTIGPYAHETQLVSPPVFSTFTTEPSTASFTPPPEPVHMTTPSSPEVPFAQLLSSSLARNRRICGTNIKYPLSQYEFQPYQYPGSPGGHIKSPGSAISTSGTSSPFPDKRPMMEFPMGEAPKFIGYEYFPTYKWGSRVGSGSLTPSGWGSRLGSGTLTPNGGMSRLGSGALTPNGGEPPSRGSNLLGSEMATLANLDRQTHNDDNVIVDHRVSFELFGEDIPTCTVRELDHSNENATSGDLQKTIAVATSNKDLMTNKDDSSVRENSGGSEVSEIPLIAEAREFQPNHRTISLGSSKDFNFNNTKGEVAEKPNLECEWWTNEKVTVKELGPHNSWNFFPLMGSGTTT